MLTKLDVFTPRITTPPFPIADGNAYSDPFQIRNIDGLGPVNASINTSQYGSVDGEIFNNAVVGKRNIVLTIGLKAVWGSYNVEDLRQILYSYFMPKQQVTLEFASTHMVTVTIDGYVETFEPNLFAKEPEYQISIICPQPYFVSKVPTILEGVTNALTDVTPTSFEYDGTVASGFVLHIDPGTTASNGEVRLYVQNPDQNPFIITANVNSTTAFEMSTVQGNKYARSIAVSTGLTTNILAKLAAGSVWAKFNTGPNSFYVQTSIAGAPWTVQYSELYGGL